MKDSWAKVFIDGLIYGFCLFVLGFAALVLKG